MVLAGVAHAGHDSSGPGRGRPAAEPGGGTREAAGSQGPRGSAAVDPGEGGCRRRRRASAALAVLPKAANLV
ncbi:hypothetical protein SLNWT_6303 [Streptomyces albus]|uniref:Uncharacterized protein n=1 Tax=Streptomyces albus (strain ATCC 21838 / DSM 41398 / FERM P-419 / JCM 4703 / NBRC 107858) TaxID=1081613 RepID=A0A0B5EXX3_STRA4|nr:hypothetical protein SLNWT_6303 [Streptomyces albus]AOU80984.1 hypothetical protein SLNHY_6293 [Streptomyces albus]AYN36687.1 hypothetical protein DUI70_6192 [Streptomyces albus]